MKAIIAGGTPELRYTIGVVLRGRWEGLELRCIAEPASLAGALLSDEPSLVVLVPHEPADCCGQIETVRSVSDVPLVVVGQSGGVETVLQGLEAGVDDWICPTCMPLEFGSRVHAVLRRRASLESCASPARSVPSFEPREQDVRLDGSRRPLSRVEEDVLRRMAQLSG